MTQDRTERICALNDQLRRNPSGGQIMMTAGIVALGAHINDRILERIATFEDWNFENDPCGEHDFGLIEIEGTEIIFKIEYYDEALEYGSEDPADPAKTTRVLTVMRADE